MKLIQFISKQHFFYRLILLHYLYRFFLALYKWSNKHQTQPRLGGEKGNPRSNKVTKSFTVSKSGVWLNTKRWIPDSNVEIKGVLFIVHGLGEHILRYEHVAEQFCLQGYCVFGLDHQGHGRSEGDRLYVDKFDDFAEDYLNYVQYTLRDKIPRIGSDGKIRHFSIENLPRFILGHSMGGVITLRTVKLSEACDIKWNGVILSAPALKVDSNVAKPHLITFANIMGRFLPKLQVGDLNPDHLCRNLLVVSQSKRDPLCHHAGPSSRLASELLKAMKVVLQDASSFTLPLLLCHGEQDTITLCDGSVDYYHLCKSKEKTLKLYPSLLHEILNEDNRDDIIQDILNWMQPFLSVKKS